MVESSTPCRPWASLCTYCNILPYAKWYAHRRHDSSAADHKRPKSASTALTWGSRLHSAYWCISLNKPVFTSPLLALEFFPAAAAAKSLQSCPALRPHRRQPTRLCHPWDSPGKNTGVGCHFLLQCMKVKRAPSPGILSYKKPTNLTWWVIPGAC